MAITTPADLIVVNQMNEVFTYKLYQNLKLLQGFMGPAGSGAPIEVVMAGQSGYYVDNPVLKPISSAEDVRDYVNGGNAVTPAEVTARNDLGVLVRRRYLVDLKEDAGTISAINMQKLLDHVEKEAVIAFMSTAQSYCIGIAKAAIDNMTTDLHTKDVWNASTRTNLTSALLVQSRAKLGDKSDVIGPGKGLWIFRSESNADLLENQLGSGVAGIADSIVRNGSSLTLGAPYVTIDDTALTAADGGFDKYYTLGLGAGFMRCKLFPVKFYPVEQRMDTESVTNLVRADFDMYFDVPGFEYDDGNGGANPSLATASTTAYWDPTYSSHLEIPGVLAIHNFSGN